MRQLVEERNILSQELNKLVKLGEEIITNLRYAIHAPMSVVSFGDYLRHFGQLDRLYTGFSDIHNRISNISGLEQDTLAYEEVLRSIDVCRMVLQYRIDMWHDYTKQRKDEFLS